MTSIRHMMSAQLRHPQPIMQFQMVFSQKLINNICLETLWELSVGEIYSHRIVNDELGRTESGRVGRRSWESQVEESLKSGLNDRVTSAQLFTCGAAAICHHTHAIAALILFRAAFFLLAHALLRIGQLVESCMVCDAWHDTFSACCVSEWVFPFRAFIEIWNAAQKQKMIKTERFVNKLRSDKNLDESQHEKVNLTSAWAQVDIQPNSTRSSGDVQECSESRKTNNSRYETFASLWVRDSVLFYGFCPPLITVCSCFTKSTQFFRRCFVDMHMTIHDDSHFFAVTAALWCEPLCNWCGILKFTVAIPVWVVFV